MTGKEISTVVGISVDSTRAVFYLEDGSDVVIRQGDPRLQRPLKEAFAQIEKHGKARIAFNDLCVFDQFAEQSNGLVRFFRAVKRTVTNFFEDDPNEKVVGDIGLVHKDKPEPTATPTALGTKVEKPVLEVTDGYPPAKAPVENTNTRVVLEDTGSSIPTDVRDLRTNETIVAVVGNTEIPGIEKLYPYILNAVSRNSPEAVTNFLQRISRVIDDRRHSIEDLLRFLEKGDLPIASDGSIIAYKILVRRDKGEFTYVDAHSKNVHQRVGSYVKMAPEMVDPNRNQSCSYGLHVARRGYIRSFSGDVCVLIRMAPEDVIAVPHNDPNKVRVCGYHILAELPKEAYDNLRANKPMNNSKDAMDLLNEALNGGFSTVTEEVWIGGELGTKLQLKPAEPKKEKPVAVAPKVEAVILTDAKEETVVAAIPVAPLAEKAQKLAAKVQKEASAAKESKKAKLSHKDEARKLFELWMNKSTKTNFDALVLYKRTVKKGWETLGFTSEEVELISSELSKK